MFSHVFGANENEKFYNLAKRLGLSLLNGPGLCDIQKILPLWHLNLEEVSICSTPRIKYLWSQTYETFISDSVSEYWISANISLSKKKKKKKKKKKFLLFF